MRHLLEIMQTEVDKMTRELGVLQGLNVLKHNVPRKRGRPSNAELAERAPVTPAAARMGWSDDPEERKAEMARRQAKARKNGSLHPRDPKHPKHDEWLAKMRKTQKKYWANMTVAQRKARSANMNAGRKAAALAVAS